MFCVCVVCLSSYKPILEYIDTQFERYLEEELKIKRSLFNCHDTRIHICLYFVAPTGHSLKSLDLVTMKKLDSKVTTESGTVCFSRELMFLGLSLMLRFCFVFPHAGEHHPCYCKGRHGIQERIGQIKDQDYE